MNMRETQENNIQYKKIQENTGNARRSKNIQESNKKLQENTRNTRK